MQTLRIQAPASKSVSHRTIIAASLADGSSKVSNVLESKDLERTIEILESAGAKITKQAGNSYAVQGTNGSVQGSADKNAPTSCDVHESGTSCRLLTAILSAGKGSFRLHGAPRMHERPLAELIKVLREQGAEITCENKEGYPPILINANAFTGGSLNISLDESSQYLSGLLLAAPFAIAPNTELCINIIGKKVVSWPYVALTLEILDSHKINFRVETRLNEQSPWQKANWRTLTAIIPQCMRIIVAHDSYKAGEYQVEGDWSSASYFFAAGALGSEPLEVSGLNPNSLQGDKAILDIMRLMGAKIELKESGTLSSFVIYPSTLNAIEIDMGYCPDLVPTVAVLAAFAQGTTKIYNVAHLRIKECDRIAVPAQSLRMAGTKVDEKEDGMWVHGGIATNKRSLELATYQDHRIAMSLSLLEFANLTPHFDDPSCVNKSFPTFWEKWATVQSQFKK